MWPLLLDMTKEESAQNLRCLELEAYASLVTALRAQGGLNPEKLTLLKETSVVLNISQERHKAEIRRAVNDEKLTTIAYHVSGQRATSEEWLQEGRRLIPLMPRIAPQTAYSAIADEVADAANKNNKQLPLPSNTERKRPSPVSSQANSSETSSKSIFRIPDLPKSEDIKKRKFPLGVENSSLAQHLMGPPKISRIQQIYRQKSKAKQKEFQIKLKQTEIEKQDFQVPHAAQTSPLCVQKIQQKLPLTPVPSPNKASKINILQNVTLQATTHEEAEVKEEPTQPIISTNEKPKFVQTPSKLTQHITLKHIATTSAGSSGEVHKTIKVCTPRKPITTKTVTTCTGQKLIVVSNPQCITTSSILQRTLTIPFVKNISVKNIDKFKIVTSSANTAVQLAPFNNPTTFTTNSKHKVVTVRTNPGLKKVIPLSQLQVLNAKGGIKVLPIGGKIVTKTNGNSASPIYIVNSTTNMQALTKSISSTPIVMSCKTQDTIEGKPLMLMDKPHAIFEEQDCETADEPKSPDEEIETSAGVISADAETFTDFESQIMQHTIQQLDASSHVDYEEAEEEMVFHEKEIDYSSNNHLEKPEFGTAAGLCFGKQVENDVSYIEEAQQQENALLLACESETCELTTVTDSVPVSDFGDEDTFTADAAVKDEMSD